MNDHRSIDEMILSELRAMNSTLKGIERRNYVKNGRFSIAGAVVVGILTAFILILIFSILWSMYAADMSRLRGMGAFTPDGNASVQRGDKP